MTMYQTMDAGFAAFVAELQRAGIDTEGLVMSRQGRRRFVLQFSDPSGASLQPWGSVPLTPTEILDRMAFAVTAMGLPTVEPRAKHREPDDR